MMTYAFERRCRRRKQNLTALFEQLLSVASLRLTRET